MEVLEKMCLKIQAVILHLALPIALKISDQELGKRLVKTTTCIQRWSNHNKTVTLLNYEDRWGVKIPLHAVLTSALEGSD